MPVVVQNVQTWRKYQKYQKYLDSFSTRGRRAWMDQRRTKSSSLEICKLLFRQINKISFFYFREFSCREVCLIVSITCWLIFEGSVGSRGQIWCVWEQKKPSHPTPFWSCRLPQITFQKKCHITDTGAEGSFKCFDSFLVFTTHLLAPFHNASPLQV